MYAICNLSEAFCTSFKLVGLCISLLYIILANNVLVLKLSSLIYVQSGVCIQLMCIYTF